MAAQIAFGGWRRRRVACGSTEEAGAPSGGGAQERELAGGWASLTPDLVLAVAQARASPTTSHNIHT